MPAFHVAVRREQGPRAPGWAATPCFGLSSGRQTRHFSPRIGCLVIPDKISKLLRMSITFSPRPPPGIGPIRSPETAPPRFGARLDAGIGSGPGAVGQGPTGVHHHRPEVRAPIHRANGQLGAGGGNFPHLAKNVSRPIQSHLKKPPGRGAALPAPAFSPTGLVPPRCLDAEEMNRPAVHPERIAVDNANARTRGELPAGQ